MNRPTLGHSSGVDPSSLRVGEVLRIAIGGVFVGFVDVNQTTTLEQVRALIRKQVSPSTQVSLPTAHTDSDCRKSVAPLPSYTRTHCADIRIESIECNHRQPWARTTTGWAWAPGIFPVPLPWPFVGGPTGACAIQVPAARRHPSVPEAREHPVGHENVSVSEHCGCERGRSSATQW